MRKVYLDRTAGEAISVYIRDAEVIPAGTTIYSISSRCRNAEYDRWQREYGKSKAVRGIGNRKESNMTEYEQVTQPFAPVYDKNSRILILGSLPSVKSREQGFYYGHARNRFWPMLAAVYQEPIPQNIPEKRALLLRHGLALYDVIESCEIKGSSDSSIRNVKAANIRSIMEASRIERILVNGRTAAKYFKAYQPAAYQQMLIELPSTSPANAAFSLERLVQIWEIYLR